MKCPQVGFWFCSFSRWCRTAAGWCQDFANLFGAWTCKSQLQFSRRTSWCDLDEMISGGLCRGLLKDCEARLCVCVCVKLCITEQGATLPFTREWPTKSLVFGYCKRTCLGMHLGTLVAAGGPTYKPYKSCFNHSLRLLPGTSQVVHGLFQKYLLQTHRFTFINHAWNRSADNYMDTCIHQTSVCSPVDFRQPPDGTAPRVIPASQGSKYDGGRCALLPLFFSFLSSCFVFLLPGADMY